MNQKTRMKAAWYETTGVARSVLQVGEMDIPKLGADEVLVRVYASGVNPVDMKRRSGRYIGASKYSRIIPHDDGAGIIEAVGEGVDKARMGERVWVYNGRLNRAFGTAGEYIAIPSKWAVRLPEKTSFVEGACLGVPAMTAHRCLFQDGSISGKTILIQGGSGGVGQYAIGLAKWDGATVIATVGEAEKFNLVRHLGADYVINYKTENVAKRVKEITNDKGVDRIVEVELAININIDHSILKPSGIIAAYASDASDNVTIPFTPLVLKCSTVHFVGVFFMPEEAHKLAIADITKCLEEGILRHPIYKRFSLDEIAAAHETTESGNTIGKNVIEII
ncbi:NADPH:quinone reductase [Fischerella sp. PCC 9605]|uniref:NADPH:quinone reductase n=1 Tax=Fischerella sp. PCC 9605 TaxID=1173024 RepID=UPI0004BBCB94|nr:NADPH:quinone reductase [Fischerella sp. PCC 9605]